MSHILNSFSGSSFTSFSFNIAVYIELIKFEHTLDDIENKRTEKKNNSERKRYLREWRKKKEEMKMKSEAKKKEII